MKHALALLLALCWVAWSAPLEAQEHLPAASSFEERGQALEEDCSDFGRALAGSRASECSFESGRFACEIFKTDVYSARRAVAEADTLELEGVVWGDGARFASIEVTTSGWSASEVEIDGWYFERLEVEGTKVRITGGRRPADSPRLSFEFAEFEDDWRVDGVRSDLAPIGNTAAGHAQNGPLIPRLRASEEHLEGDFAWVFHLFPGLGVAPLVTVAPAAWYGFGAGLVTSESDFAQFEIHYDADDEQWVPFAAGQARLYDKRRQRLGAHLEHPGPDPHWETRRIENRAWMRDIRRTELGLSASGASHSLLASAWIDSRLDQSVLEFDRWLMGSRYGMRFFDDELLEAEVGLESLTRIQGEDDRAHSATAVLDLAMPVGSRDRAVVTPRLIGLANFGVLPEDLGFEASTTVQIFAGLDASLAFRGDFEGATHFLTPRISIRRELYGVLQRPLLPPTAPSFIYTGVPDFTLVEAWIDQRIEGSEWAVGLPLGLLSATAGLDGFIESFVPAFRPSFRWGMFYVESGAVCRIECSSLALYADASIEILSWLSLGGGAHRASSDDIALVSDTVRRTSALTFSRFSQFDIDLPDAWSTSAWVLFDLDGPWAGFTAFEWVEREELTGARLNLSYTPRGTGWSIDLGAAGRTDETYSMFAGFSAR